MHSRLPPKLHSVMARYLGMVRGNLIIGKHFTSALKVTLQQAQSPHANTDFKTVCC